jgi:tetratricopeptide (TPR) repeat protein
MTALLDALARRTRSHRRWTLAAVAAAVALGSAAIATWLVSTPAPDPCAPPTARLAAVWSPARAAAIRAQLVAVDPAQGAARFAKVAAALDTRAEAFSAMHVAACRATRVDGRQPDAVLDRRMQCLDRWLVELDDTAAVIAQATDLPAVDRAAYAAIAMPPVDACGDRAAAGPPLPAGAAERATAIALANRTAEIAVARRADRLEGIERETAELVAAARALGHAPTLVGALVVQVRVLLELSNRAATEPILHELVELAPRVGDDRAEAFAWLHLATVTLLARGKYDDAVALFPSARAAVLRAGDPIDLHAEQLYDEGIVLDRGPTPVQGRAKLREARALLERAGAAAPSSPLAEHLSDVLDETATSYIYTDELDAAIAAYHEAMAQRRAIFDTGSAQEAYVWNNLASALEQAGRLDEALDAAREAVRIRETRVGESVALANSLNTLADAMSELGQSRESLPFYERALRMSQAKRPPGDIRLAPLYLGYAHALAGVRRYDEATRYYGESVALFDKTGAKNLNLPITLTHRGELAALRGRCAEALPDYARAIALVEQLSGPTSSWMVGPLTGQAACLVQGERPGDAIPVLRRALGCKTNAGQKAQLAVAMSWLGRALVESRRDVHGGLAMARTARAALATAPGAADDLAVLDRWLAAHAR